MYISLPKTLSPLRRALSVCALLAISACAAPSAQGIQDPHEQKNRATHEGNKVLDETIVKPMSGAYGGIVPDPVRQGVGNFASNLSLPGTVVNNLLQLDVDGALKNSSRFLFNTTIGLGGVLDPSSAMGLHEVETDFGETLHVWGVPEGNYVELPVLGPSTERDMAGMVVDVFTNPLTFGTSSPEKYLNPVVKGLAKLDDRYRYTDTVDSILYESEDSYAQARLLYLQNRRFELTGEDQAAADEQYEDPYDELFGN